MIKKNKLFIYDLLIFFGFFIIYALMQSIFIKIYNVYIDIIILILLTSILVLIYKNIFINDFKKINKDIYKYFLIFILGYIGMIIFNNILIYFLNNISVNESLVITDIIKNPFLSIISVCIIPPIYEEILIRLNFKNLFKNKWTYSIVIGLLFSLLHVLSSTNIFEFLFIIPYFIMGFSLCYIYFNSNNIYYPIIFHIINNLFALIVLFIGGTI